MGYYSDSELIRKLKVRQHKNYISTKEHKFEGILFKKRITNPDDLPAEIRKMDTFNKIRNFFPIQIKAFDAGILNHRNLVLCAPTGMGKTLPIDISAIKTVVDGHKKVIFLEPYLAITNQKVGTLANETLNIIPGQFTGETNDNPSRSNIIYATAEKLFLAIQNREIWLNDVGLLVVDECDILNDINRGAILEEVISCFITLYKDAQIVMLSATLSNGEDLAKWIGGTYISDNTRNVKIKYELYPTFDFTVEELKKIEEQENQIFITLENPIKPLENKNPSENEILVATSTRKEAKKLCWKLLKSRGTHSSTQDLGRYLSELGKKIKREAKYGMDKISKMVSITVHAEVAVHNAGLTRKQRTLIESAFEEKLIKILVCTPTLNRGINLQLKKLILYNGIKKAEGLMTVSEFHQLCGRVGRPGQENVGEVIICCNSFEEMVVAKEKIMGRYELVESKLKPHIASFIILLVGAGYSLKIISQILMNTLFASMNFESPIVKDFNEAALLSTIKSAPTIFDLINETPKLTKFGELCFRYSGYELKDIKELCKSITKKAKDETLNKSDLIELINTLISKRKSQHAEWTLLLNAWLSGDKNVPKPLETEKTDFGTKDFKEFKKRSKNISNLICSLIEYNDIDKSSIFWIFGLPNCIEFGLDPIKYGELAAISNNRKQACLLTEGFDGSIKIASEKTLNEYREILGHNSFASSMGILKKLNKILGKPERVSVGEAVNFIHCPLSFLLDYYYSLKNMEMLEKDIQEKTEIGGNVHKYIHKFCEYWNHVGTIVKAKGLTLDLIGRDSPNNIDEITSAFNNFCNFLLSNNFKAANSSEKVIESKKLEIQGILDLVLLDYNNYLTLIEIKSGDFQEYRYEQWDQNQIYLYYLILRDCDIDIKDAFVLYLKPLTASYVDLSEEKLRKISSYIGAMRNLMSRVDALKDENLRGLCTCRNSSHKCVCNQLFDE